MAIEKTEWIDGRPVYPGGATEYRKDVAERELARDRKRWQEAAARRREVIKAEDEVYEARQTALKEAHDAAAREKAEAAAAEKRAAIEHDLRLDGVPESQVKKLADDVMAQWFRDRALAAANEGDRVQRELRDYFRRMPAPSVE